MDYIEYIRERVGNDVINLTGVNVIILNEKKEILLQKRATYPYKWGLIGGITELGESLEETAIRETKEETGLDINNLELLDTVSGKGCYMEMPNGHKAYFITVGFYTYDYKGKLNTDNEETEILKFFGYNTLPDNIPLSHRRMIELFLRRVK
jgi:ADP-ribose pyrophosphatase YjhB (NUDIX family)